MIWDRFDRSVDRNLVWTGLLTGGAWSQAGWQGKHHPISNTDLWSLMDEMLSARPAADIALFLHKKNLYNNNLHRSCIYIYIYNLYNHNMFLCLFIELQPF